MHQLLEAESARLRGGDPKTAIARYAQAATRAYAIAYTHHEALAHERSARLLREIHQPAAARAEYAAAVDAFRRWGATHKAQEIERERSRLANTPP